MKKRRNLKEIAKYIPQNPVAKYSISFNKAKVFTDKSKYRRKAKHAKQEAFPINLAGEIRNVSCLDFFPTI